MLINVTYSTARSEPIMGAVKTYSRYLLELFDSE